MLTEDEVRTRDPACQQCSHVFRVAGPLSLALRCELETLLREGKPVVAIRLIREKTGCSLPDAKGTFEHLVIRSGLCHRCKAPLVGADYEDCQRCGALNIRVHYES